LELLVFAAKMLTENGVDVIIDATGNRRRFREQARQAIPNFMEVYLKCPLEVCMKREAERENTHLAPADIYEKGKKGKAPTVPGIGVPYEEPLNPEIKLDSSKLSAEECVEKIFAVVLKQFDLEPEKS
jgi:adenylylsulfate kinase